MNPSAGGKTASAVGGSRYRPAARSLTAAGGGAWHPAAHRGQRQNEPDWRQRGGSPGISCSSCSPGSWIRRVIGPCANFPQGQSGCRNSWRRPMVQAPIALSSAEPAIAQVPRRKTVSTSSTVGLAFAMPLTLTTGISPPSTADLCSTRAAWSHVTLASE